MRSGGYSPACDDDRRWPHPRQSKGHRERSMDFRSDARWKPGCRGICDFVEERSWSHSRGGSPVTDSRDFGFRLDVCCRRALHDNRGDDCSFPATIPGKSIAAVTQDWRRSRQVCQPARAESLGSNDEVLWTAFSSHTPRSANHSRTHGNCYLENDFNFGYFDGDSQIDAYMEWEQEIERSFDYLGITQEEQVCFVVSKLIGRAKVWWKLIKQARRIEGRGDIRTWSKMKKLLRSQFLSSYYVSELEEPIKIVKKGDEDKLFDNDKYENEEVVDGELGESSIDHMVVEVPYDPSEDSQKKTGESSKTERLRADEETNDDIEAIWEYADSTSYLFIGRVVASNERLEKLEGSFSLTRMPQLLVFFLEGSPPRHDLLIISVVVAHSTLEKFKSIPFGINIIENNNLNQGQSKWSPFGSCTSSMSTGPSCILPPSATDSISHYEPPSGRYFVATNLTLGVGDRWINGGHIEVIDEKWNEIIGSFRLEKQPSKVIVYVQGPSMGVNLKGVDKNARFDHWKQKTDKEKFFYAPTSGVGDLLYDKNVVYIDINDHFVQYSKVDDENGTCGRNGKDYDVGETLVKTLQTTIYSIDEKLDKSFINLFSVKPFSSSHDANISEDKNTVKAEINENLPGKGGFNGRNSYYDHEHIEPMDETCFKENDEIEKMDMTKEIEPVDSDEENDYHDEVNQQIPTKYDQEEAEFHNGKMRRKASSNLEDLEVSELYDATHVEVEGFRTGTYMKLEIHNVPFELVENFDPHHPILVGGIGLGEDNVGYIQARFKCHRWHKKVLKTRDPIIVSIGGRRYQTIPIYAIEDQNGRHRTLKYTPEHMHCFAMFWGPLAPPSAGVIADKLHNSFPFGSCISRSSIENEEFVDFFVKNFNRAVFGNEFKWYHTESEHGRYNSRDADGLLDFCRKPVDIMRPPPWPSFAN